MNSSRFCLFCATYSGFTLYRWRVIIIWLSSQFRLGVAGEAQTWTYSASASLAGSRAPQLGALKHEVTIRARAAAKTLAQTLKSGRGRYGAVLLEMLHHVLEVIGHPVGGEGPQALDPLVEIVADVFDRAAKRLAPEFRAGFSGQNVLGYHLVDFRQMRVSMASGASLVCVRRASPRAQAHL